VLQNLFNFLTICCSHPEQIDSQNSDSNQATAFNQNDNNILDPRQLGSEEAMITELNGRTNFFYEDVGNITCLVDNTQARISKEYREKEGKAPGQDRVPMLGMKEKNEEQVNADRSESGVSIVANSKSEIAVLYDQNGTDLNDMNWENSDEELEEYFKSEVTNELVEARDPSKIDAEMPDEGAEGKKSGADITMLSEPGLADISISISKSSFDDSIDSNNKQENNKSASTKSANQTEQIAKSIDRNFPDVHSTSQTNKSTSNNFGQPSGSQVLEAPKTDVADSGTTFFSFFAWILNIFSCVHPTPAREYELTL
jgi:hypothetical protein